MVPNRFIKFVSLLPALLIPGAVYGQTPMSSAITVQGGLKKGGAPVNGMCDFRFRLWDASAAGFEAALMQTVLGTTLDEGIFTSRLDFGDDAFNGDARWLETAVKCFGDADFVVLSPRQEVTGSPHAFVNRGQHKEFNALSPSVTNGYTGNYVDLAATGTTISGGGVAGFENLAYDNYGTIGGGRGNVIGVNDFDTTASQYATIAGGDQNRATATNSTVSGGYSNEATALNAVVSGGFDNTASAPGATVPGGTGNTASGADSAAMGSGSTAAGISSVAMGSTAQALHDGSMVFKASALAATAAPFSSTAPNQFLISASGGVGIGTNAPTAALDVTGTVRASNILQAGSTILVDGVLHEIRSQADLDLFVIGAPKKMTLTAGGNVGIGTLAPSSTLHVVGTTNLSDALTVDTTTLTVDALNNRVGIGTAAPSAALDVVGATKVSGALTVDTTTLAVDATNNRVGIGTAAPSAALDVVGASELNGALTVDTTTLTVDATNNRVGIGTAAPSVALDVVGAANVSGALTVDTDTLVVDATNNRVGIGTATPTSPLYVDSFLAAPSIKTFNASGGTSAVRYALWGECDGIGCRALYGRASSLSGSGAYGVWGESLSSSGRGVYGLATSASGTNYAVYGSTNSASGFSAYFDGVAGSKNYFAQDVGIGTASPSGRLHVVGGAGDTTAVVLPNDSISAPEIDDEPGVADNESTGFIALSGVDQDLLSRIITVPSSGFVLAIGTCEADVTTSCLPEFCVDQVNADFWVSNASALLGLQYVQASLRMGQGDDAIVPVTVHRLFAVTAGTHTFYFGADEDVGAWTIFRPTLTLVFFPTSYGTTVASASAGNTAAPGEDADALPAEGVAGPDQATAVEHLATAVERTQPTLDPQYVQEQFGAISEQLAERNARLEDMETHNADLEARNTNLEANNARLEARLTAIEALLATLAVEDGVDSVRTGKEGAR